MKRLNNSFWGIKKGNVTPWLKMGRSLGAVLFLVASISIASCATTQERQPQNIKITYDDLYMLNFGTSQIPESVRFFWGDTFTFNSELDVYIIESNPEEQTLRILDEIGGDPRFKGILISYPENIERRYDKDKLYKVKFTATIFEDADYDYNQHTKKVALVSRTYGIRSVVINSIDGLLSLEELAELDAQKEKERELVAERQAHELAEQEAKKLNVKEELATERVDLSDYFGTHNGIAFVYVTKNDEGKEVIEEVHIASKKHLDKFVVVHTTKTSLLPGASTTNVYEVYPDRVVWVASRNILGQNKKHSEIVMKQPGEKWRVNTDAEGEYYEYASYLVEHENGIMFLVVQKDIYTHNELFVQEKKFYNSKAKGEVGTDYTTSKGDSLPTRVLSTMIKSELLQNFFE